MKRTHQGMGGELHRVFSFSVSIYESFLSPKQQQCKVIFFLSLLLKKTHTRMYMHSAYTKYESFLLESELSFIFFLLIMH